MKKVIPYGRQSIDKSDIKSVTKALKSNYLTTGPLTKIFELKFTNQILNSFIIEIPRSNVHEFWKIA